MRPYTVHTQKKQHRSRRVLAGIVLLLLAAAGGFLYRLPVSLQDISAIFQSAAGNFFSSSAPEKNKTPASEPLRGTIYDQHFNELAVSYSLFSLYVYPAKIEDHQQVAGQLAEILHQPAEALAERLAQSYRVVRIADNLDERQVAAIDALGIEGVSCRRREARFYPGNTAAAHILGYASEGVGLAGVEKRFDIALQPGGYDAGDLPEVELPAGVMQGQQGSDLVLTLEVDLQKELDTYLQDILKKEDADRAMAVLLDPGSGRILAAASLPSFNPNYFWQASGPSRQNGLVQPFFSLQCLRPLLVRAAARLRLGEVKRPLLPETIAASDFGLDEPTLDEVVDRLALLDSVSESLPEDDAEGMPVAADGGSLNLLQVSAGLASLVNGGWRHAPRVLDSVYDVASKKRFVRRSDMPAPVHVLSPAMGILVRRDLLQPLQKKRRKRSDFFYVNSVVQVRDQDQMSEYSRQQIMVGMLPVKKPQMLLVVGLLHDHLKPDGPDGKTVSRKKLVRGGRELLTRLATLHEQGRERIASHPAGKDERNFSRFLISRRMEYTPREQETLALGETMPDLIGMSLRKGMRHLNGHKVLVEVEGSGHIVAQQPPAGTSLAQVKVCRLTLDSRI